MDSNSKGISFALSHTSAGVKPRAALAKGSTGKRRVEDLVDSGLLVSRGSIMGTSSKHVSNWPTSLSS